MKRFFCLIFFLFAVLCQAEEPIALYLTWQRSPDTTMIVNWITPMDQTDDLVMYQQSGSTEWQQASGGHRTISEKEPYFLHGIELVNLFPNTDYFFRIGADGNQYKFRTMPSVLEEPIRFIEGGDMYHDEEVFLHQTNRQAAKTNPYFALAGGDLAYADKRNYWFFGLFNDGHEQKFARWLTWLTAWKNDMVTEDGRLIPLLPAIGNHDTNGHFDQTPNEALYFYKLFPMPGLQGYNVLDFGNYMSLFILDSGHTHPVGGQQAAWLEKELKERENVHTKFALYHVPAYPSYRDPNDERSLEVRKHWPPLFEKYGLTVAFEHHDHTYKRTNLIGGVLYLGDGAWGMKNPRKAKTPNQRWYLAKTASERHFILVTLDRDKRNFKAISDNGEILDETEI